MQATTLLLIPTALERERLESSGPWPKGLHPELAGFGPIAAAARCAALLAAHRPQRVLLAGIAGSLDPKQLPIGTASCFARVHIDGIGAGEGPTRLGSKALGFPQWPKEPGSLPIEDSLPLADQGQTAELLSVCSCSASATEAQERRRRFPSALAEDMEGFGVAMACSQAGVPLTIVRGISNQAGIRDSKQWQIAAALDAARECSLAWLEQHPL